jgi:gliding motility-associated lipoprotein GldH
MKCFQILIGIILLSNFLISCDSNRIYEKNVDIPDTDWYYNMPIVLDFTIEDETPKNLFVNVRHSFYFPWRNIWLKMSIAFPNDSIYEMPLNIQLSQPNGKWFGKCSGDICLLQYALPDFTHYNFLDTGNYSVKIEQDMRENPLSSILSVGLRVENVVEKQ